MSGYILMGAMRGEAEKSGYIRIRTVDWDALEAKAEGREPSDGVSFGWTKVSLEEYEAKQRRIRATSQWHIFATSVCPQMASRLNLDNRFANLFGDLPGNVVAGRDGAFSIMPIDGSGHPVVVPYRLTVRVEKQADGNAALCHLDVIRATGGGSEGPLGLVAHRSFNVSSPEEAVRRLCAALIDQADRLGFAPIIDQAPNQDEPSYSAPRF